MMKKEWFGFPMMAVGVAGLGWGGRMASGGETAGWIGVLGGITLLAASYFVMRPAAEAPPPETAEKTSKTPASSAEEEAEKPPSR